MDSKAIEGPYLIVDIGNTLTKAAFVEKTDGSYHIRGVDEASTTIDPPDLDVTVGVKNAVIKLGQGLGVRVWDAERPSKDHRFLCSSSTSGGLHMMVAGVISMISAESAQRAALGAGALLMDVFSKDDPRPEYEMVGMMMSLRPDMFLLAGGTDGGAVDQVLDMAELVKTADVRPRFGSEYKLPVVYAGNIEVRKDVTNTLSEDKYATRVVENVRPVIDKENLGPAREGIYDSYMEHVIIHSPGYNKLVDWVDRSIIPTQAAIGKLLYTYAMERGVNLVGLDIGGATTDVYSVFNGVFNRSLNADIGMTYGISNIMKQAGINNILRWIPAEMDERTVRNIVGNMMIHQPEYLTPEEALVQQAAVREAIKLGVDHHKGIARSLKGVLVKRTISDIFDQYMEATYLDMMKTQVIIGCGRVLTHGRTGERSTMLLIDALEPEGITKIMIDRSSIIPHLGMLLEINQEAALEILSKECLHMLGTCVAPRGITKEGEEAMKIRMTMADGVMIHDEVSFGELKTLPLGVREVAEVVVTPTRRFDVGRGKGRSIEAVVTGGEKGLIIDARGRPLKIPKNKEVLEEWMNSLMKNESPALKA
jgi:uncharacterized protein (TIGR01319 family)